MKPPADEPAPNRGYRHREQIGPDGAGATALAHLVARHPQADEATWTQRIRSGAVTLDERTFEPDQRLVAGQWLVWNRPPWIEPEVPWATAVLYEDGDLLAVAKPDGLPTLPGGGLYLEHTLLALVRRRAPEARPMHRLGRSTSGLVLFARTAEAAGAVQVSFRSHGLRKVYRALCAGHPIRDRFEVAAPIGDVPHALLGTVHGACPGGKSALSHVRVLERREGCSLVEVEIETGRPHQIRIHLAFAGHPLVGDPLYGAGGLPQPGTRALPGDPGYRLHAFRLELVHPRTLELLSLVCAPPSILRLREAAPDRY